MLRELTLTEKPPCQHGAGGSPTSWLAIVGPTTRHGEILEVTTPTRLNRTDLPPTRPPHVPDQRTLNLRKKIRIATWNVQTLLRTGYATLLSRELGQYNISLAGICEARWPGNGETITGDHCFIWSGPTDGRGLYGVALAIPTRLRRSLLSWKPVNDRLLSARFLHQHGKMTVIVAYGPTNQAEEAIKDAFSDQLLQLIQEAPPHDITIVLTDFNASLSAASHIASSQPVSGPVYIDTFTNDNGNRLLNLCRSSNLCIADTWFPRKQIHHWTWYSPDGITRKALDHILISQRWRSFVTNCRVYRGAELGNTDHRLLVAEIKLKLKTNTPAKFLPRLDSARLSDPAMQASYQCAITNRYSVLADEVSTDWQHFKSEVCRAAEETIGRAKPAPKKPWISNETLEIIEQRRAARLSGDSDSYRRLNAVRNAAIRRDREKFWEEQATLLESASQRNNQQQVFSLLRRAKAGPRQRSFLVKDSAGAVLSTEHDCINRWQEHFSQLLNHPPIPEDPILTQAANSPIAPNPDCQTTPVSLAEVKAALKKLKNSKAPGICSITAEMLKAGGDNMSRWLTQIINFVWIYERLPDDWRRGIILPFWKRKGDQLVCSNHRGITLLSIPGKLFTRILLSRAIPALHSHRRPQQAGFMPNRSTTDHISALRLLIEKVREFRKDRHLYIGFIDLKAAFDTVDHPSLWKILKTLGVPDKIISLFQRLYGNAESCVRINGKDSDWFTIISGVRQGCVAAPDLFNCVIDYLMTRVTERIPGVTFGNHNLADLEYADDTTMLCNTAEELRDALTIFNEEASKLGLNINWSKTELMHVGEGPDPPPLTFNNITVKYVPTFTYLGSTIAQTGDLKPEIDRRRALASGVMQSLWRPLWRHRSISQRTKLRIYNASVISVLLYGSETWALNKTLAARLDGFDSQALRTIERIHWTQHIPNTEVRRRTQQPPASRIAAQHRVRWFGHVKRLPPEHPTRAVLEFHPQAAGWRRPRGAPRTRWLDVIKQDLRDCHTTLAQAEQLVHDKREWKRMVYLVGSTRPDVQED